MENHMPGREISFRKSLSSWGLTMTIAEDIKSALEFYRAMGFERLPIRIKRGKPISCRSRALKPSFHSGPVESASAPGEANAPELRTGSHFGIKEAALKALSDEIGDCGRCKLSNKRTHVVFGEGNPDARLMFIGEAPGREEDLQARPFVGDAGKLLTRLIEKMGFRREDVYIANIVKCRPPMNRDPEGDEIEVCKGFLDRQIKIIAPDIIMALGRISALTLIGNATLKITAIRGKMFDYEGIPLMPTFHPAYLIRNPKDKWLTWNDAQKVIERLGKSG
jgi:uracil-DNA glycosylase family 4